MMNDVMLLLARFLSRCYGAIVRDDDTYMIWCVRRQRKQPASASMAAAPHAYDAHAYEHTQSSVFYEYEYEKLFALFAWLATTPTRLATSYTSYYLLLPTTTLRTAAMTSRSHPPTASSFNL
jgi:hypothetical protein